MKFPCEIVVREILPAVRAIVARELAKRELTRSEIAAKLGVSVASVSYYLSRKRGRSTYVEQLPKLKKAGKRAAELIALGSASMIDVMGVICGACRDLRRRDALCEMHMAELPPLQVGICDLCDR